MKYILLSVLMFPIFIHATTPTCTVSLQFPKPNTFTYAKDWMVLDQPEWNNATTSTGGLPGCFTGTKLFGYSSVKPSGGFLMDENGETTAY